MANAVVIEPMIAENINSESATAGTALVAAVGGFAEWGAVTGVLPLTAGSGQALTGPLYMNPGSDDSAILFRVPTTSTNNGDILFNVNRADFSGVQDVVFNLGFNQSVGGSKVDSDIHAWAFQMENDYYTGGKHWVEAMLALSPVTGDALRPLMLQYETDASEGYFTIRATTFSVAPLTGGYHAIYVTTTGDQPTSVKFTGAIELWPTAASGSGVMIQGLDGVNPCFNLDTNTDAVAWKLSAVRWATKADADVLSIDMGTKQINTTGLLSLIPSAASVNPFRIIGLAGQSANLIHLYNSDSATLWAIKPNGAMLPATLADAAADNGTVYYSSTASKLVYKDSGGTVNALY